VVVAAAVVEVVEVAAEVVAVEAEPEAEEAEERVGEEAVEEAVAEAAEVVEARRLELRGNSPCPNRCWSGLGSAGTASRSYSCGGRA
jgi:hypothetical protein